MTTEQQEQAARNRQYGSGRIVKAVRKRHPCDMPNAVQLAMTYDQGTTWRCTCGRIYELKCTQMDGWIWTEILTPPPGPTPYTTEPK